MNKEEGILDDIEELVSDFQKKKSSLKNIGVLDFVNDYVKMDKPLTDFQKQYFNHLDHLDKNYYKQEYPPEPEYNRKVPFHCRCGMKYIVFINQDEEMVDYMRSVHDPNTYNNAYEQRFYCMKCGNMSCITMSSDFEIISIKHDTNFKIR